MKIFVIYSYGGKAEFQQPYSGSSKIISNIIILKTVCSVIHFSFLYTVYYFFLSSLFYIFISSSPVFEQ